MPNPTMDSHETVLVVDFGTQYCQLIARRVRECRVYAEILPCHKVDADVVRERSPRAIVLSGGPASVYAEGAPRIDAEILKLGIPTLGICYGMQLGVQLLGGDVRPTANREYGPASFETKRDTPVFRGIPMPMSVWMSHGDSVDVVSDDFEVLGATKATACAAVRHRSLPFYGVQFHPEVHHTPRGTDLLRHFLFDVAGCTGDWRMESFVDEAVQRVRDQVGDAHVVLGLSGGVDSAVVAALLDRAIGEQATAIFVDNGLLRAGERESVAKVFGEGGEGGHLRLQVVDASERFLNDLAGVVDPNEKRKIIGREFVHVFQEEIEGIPESERPRFLAQGTLYPDVIESVPAHDGPTAAIKPHHNVGGLPETLHLELVEPLRELFKDEVRELGIALGLPESIVWRQPFPGPGLAVRVVGEITAERLRVLRAADAIVREEIREAGLERQLWQSFAVYLPIHSVGVMGDERTYEACIGIRAVESVDGMTADWVYLPREVLATISARIVGEVKGVNRVVLDISSKPPATIEWE